MMAPIRCVAADDEYLVREYLKSIIVWENFGFELCGVGSDGEEALRLIQKYRPQVLLVDINMPYVDGLSLLSKLKQEPDFRYMHTIIISGYQVFEYAQKAINLSVEKYLLKPFTKEELLQCLLSVKEKIITVDNILESNQEEKILSPPNAEFVYQQFLSQLGDPAKNTRSKKLLKEAIQYICQNYAEDLTVQKIASRLYVSSSYLRKVFANELNSSVVSILEEVRLNAACDLLQKNAYYIADIAEMIGYHNPSYFTKVFKAKFGITPSEYHIQFFK